MKNITIIPVSRLRPFEGHPYKVKDDDEMNTLIESIQEQGILSPLVVRPIENTNEYEVISGHRRLHAAKKAGIVEVPALIYALDRDAAAIAVVDSNLHREHILPSEKAFAYKMKMDALKHQGTSCQLGTKLRSDELIAETANESARQIQRYIRLTHLVPQLLDCMDEGKMAISVGVELSYLDDRLQYAVLDAMQQEDCTPSYAQVVRMRNLFRTDELTIDTIYDIIREEKANQKEKVSFKADDLRRFFPKNYTVQDMQKAIMQIVEADYRRRQRYRDDGAR
jgi:ParB family transcriptional regulator, chromosome partitioning protein